MSTVLLLRLNLVVYKKTYTVINKYLAQYLNFGNYPDSCQLTSVEISNIDLKIAANTLFS